MAEAKTEASVTEFFCRRGGLEFPRHLDCLLRADIEAGFLGNNLEDAQ